MQVLELRVDAERDPQGRNLQRVLNAHAACERSRRLRLMLVHAIAAVGLLALAGKCWPQFVPPSLERGVEGLLGGLLAGAVKVGVQEWRRRNELARLASLQASSTHGRR